MIFSHQRKTSVASWSPMYPRYGSALEDSRPARIRGYGAMSKSSAESLEADLQKMLQIANRIRILLNS